MNSRSFKSERFNLCTGTGWRASSNHCSAPCFIIFSGIIISNVRSIIDSKQPPTPILLKSVAIHLPFPSRYFCMSMPSCWQKVIVTPPITITIRLPFVALGKEGCPKCVRNRQNCVKNASKMRGTPLGENTFWTIPIQELKMSFCSEQMDRSVLGTDRWRSCRTNCCSAHVKFYFLRPPCVLVFAQTQQSSHGKAGRSIFEIGDSNPIGGKCGKGPQVPLTPRRFHGAKPRKTWKRRTRKHGKCG